MSFSAARLTCFALITALEQDLRTSIHQHLIDQEVTAALSNEQVERAQARRGRDQSARATTSLPALLPYLDFADSYEILLRNRSDLPVALMEQLDCISAQLERLTAIRNRVAHTRPMEIDDLSNLLDVARTLSDPTGGYWTETDATLTKLGEDPAYVIGLTIDLPTEASRGPVHNLPVPDFDETGFFGRRLQVNRVKKIIKGPYPVVSILGDGGIGKTSVALKVAYELLDDPRSNFDAIVWVSAKATVLTVHEIERINDAIEDSLGLFMKAAEELGANDAGQDPVTEVLAYLENFRILLILDNLETVLDTRLRDFLLDLPVGSKVMLTSRIGAGVENPVTLEALSPEDSHSLLRALARIREVGAIQALTPDAVQDLAGKMSGHPAYIRWFVSGVQAGRRPEELLSDNTLLLEFCMSNVYEYLDMDARAVLEVMQILPGQKSQAEVAFVARFSAQTAQSALLQLLTTNFIQMESQTPLIRALETTYKLSEFGRAYLDKQHPVPSDRRRAIMARNQEMHDLGWRLQVENSASPYDPYTVHIRDSGDFSTARLLRDAMNSVELGDFDSALSSCGEAQVLSPMYHEAWRVEALVQTAISNHSAARSAYERAYELQPESSTLSYFFGCFLLDEQIEFDGALRYLRAAAQLDERNPEVYQKLAWALLTGGNYDDAVAASAHVFALNPSYSDASIALIVGLRAVYYRTQHLLRTGYIHQALEALETTFELVDRAWPELIKGEACDRLLQLSQMAEDLKSSLEEDDNFRMAVAARFGSDFRSRVSAVDPTLLDRRIARVQNIVDERYFGFIRMEQGADYFFHLRDLCDQANWSYLEPGSHVAIRPNPSHPRGRRAEEVRWID